MRRKAPKPAGQGKDPFVGVRIPAEVLALIDETAAEQDSTRSGVIRSMIAAQLDLEPEATTAA